MNKELANYFKVLSDPNRLEIIELLLKGETCGCTLIDKLPITQPTLSYHLKHISDAGLSKTKREGNWIKHFIERDKLNEMIDYLTSLRDMKLETCEVKENE
jgi:ArsR family transcriptional regulator